MSDRNNGQGEGNYPPVKPVPDTEEFNTLKQHFLAKFNQEPEFYVSVPGRVNLIGEHVDYCGYSVCPMAVQQHISIAFKLSDDSVVRLTNVKENYQDYQCEISEIR